MTTQALKRLRGDCNLQTLRPIKVLGEGAFGVVQLVQHRVQKSGHGLLRNSRSFRGLLQPNTGSLLFQKTGEVFALKQMQKARIVKTGQERNVLNEKALLVNADHPYVGRRRPCPRSSTRGSHNGCYMVTCVTQILKLVNAFQTKDCLYLVLEFLQGGDIFGHLYKQGGKFTSRMAIFYTSIGTTHSHTRARRHQ